MDAFPRAFDSCLKTANISRAEAAAKAGMHPSVLSRLLNGDTQLMLSHVEALCRALNDKGDRQYCVHAWLKDQCPAEFIDDITITFSTVLEDKIRKPDALSDSIARLDKAASRNPELKRILSYLAELEDDPPDKSLRTSGERAPDSISA